MRIQPKLLVPIFCLGAITANAAEFEDFGRVVNVTPQVEQFNQPRQECRTEYVEVQQRQQQGVGGAILGGLVGGLAGNQVGGGNGRTAATAIGAVTGAIVGDRMENNGNNRSVTTEQPVRQCHTVDNWQNRTSGYAVTYEYRGHDYTTVMPYDPGERLKLHVSLTPR
jgi:uncharacterized protein YcfJ